jgi:hypothetical protein
VTGFGQGNVPGDLLKLTSEHGEVLVIVAADGTVTLSDSQRVQEAAAIFWAAIASQGRSICGERDEALERARVQESLATLWHDRCNALVKSGTTVLAASSNQALLARVVELEAEAETTTEEIRRLEERIAAAVGAQR